MLFEVYHELKSVAVEHGLLDNWSTIDKQARFEKMKKEQEERRLKSEFLRGGGSSDNKNKNNATCVELQTDGNLAKSTMENFYDANLYRNRKNGVENLRFLVIFKIISIFVSLDLQTNRKQQ